MSRAMLMPVAHAGEPLAPHDAWAAWNTDPVMLGGLVVIVALYVRGRSSHAASPTRPVAFSGAVGALTVAFVSPLEAMAGSLAAAHMVQHVVLVLVAAPLLAVARPGTRLVRGLPSRARGRALTGVHVRGPTRRLWESVQHPVLLWLLHVGTLWFWHAAGPYQAAIDHEALHLLEHGMFLGTGVLVWRVIVGPVARNRRDGMPILVLFGLVVQSVLLSALLTFASAPWYTHYLTTAPAWGLSALTDQHLAGLIMWVPGGLVYVLVAVGLVARWIRRSDPASSV